MYSISKIVLAGVFAVTLSSSADAGSLLGGLIKTGSDSGNSGGIISTNGNGSIGLLGSGGVSVNLGLGGGSGSGGSGSGGSHTIGVPHVLTVSTSGSSGGGVLDTVSVLGGHNNVVGVNPLGLLGNGGGIRVALPGIGGTNGLLGGDGTNGNNGTDGANGLNGLTGGNGFGGLRYGRGGNGGGFALPGDLSNRMRLLLKILEDRDFLRVSDGRAVCLRSFGVAQIGGWLPQKDVSALNRVLPMYQHDIQTLRQLLSACRAGGQQQALNGTLGRVVALDIREDGTPVLFVL